MDRESKLVGFRTFLHLVLVQLPVLPDFLYRCLFFVMVTNLARAGWCATVRRVAEILAVNITWWAVLFLPIIAMVLMTDSGSLYPWNSPDSTLPADKLSYFEGKFFTIRAVVYFCVWILFASYFYAKSREQDENGSAEISPQAAALRWPGIMLFAWPSTLPHSNGSCRSSQPG